MTDRATIVKNLITVGARSPSKILILKGVRKRKHYAKLATNLGIDKSSASRGLNLMKALDLVEGEGGYFRQTRIMRTINIESEIKKSKSKRRHTKRLGEGEDKASKEIEKVLDLEKGIEFLEMENQIREDCFPLRKPYRNRVGEAYLTLENILRDELGLPDHIIGVALVSEAKKAGLFDRSVNSERDGLVQLYNGAFMWLRNVAHHRKDVMSRYESLKTILFADYLIKLIRKQKLLNHL